MEVNYFETPVLGLVVQQMVYTRTNPDGDDEIAIKTGIIGHCYAAQEISLMLLDLYQTRLQGIYRREIVTAT